MASHCQQAKPAAVACWWPGQGLCCAPAQRALRPRLGAEKSLAVIAALADAVPGAAAAALTCDPVAVAALPVANAAVAKTGLLGP